MLPERKTYFFCGIGGSGMSALALALLARGHEIKGSDRSHDKHETPEKFRMLAGAGIELYPQDGSGLQKIDSARAILVVSDAVEETIPDVQAARARGIDVRKRGDVLAELFNTQRGIAVIGTSGKSTVTAMLGHVLTKVGFDPTVINGAPMINAIEEGARGLGNTVIGRSDLMVIEADESQGRIDFNPDYFIVTNLGHDHRPLEQLQDLFRAAVERARKGVVINLDNREVAALAHINPHRTMTFSLADDRASLFGHDAAFDINGTSLVVRDTGTGHDVKFRLPVPGKHNAENALAAIGGAMMAGVTLQQAAAALESFHGVSRRFQTLGKVDGITVRDDFGHNGDKVGATVATLKLEPGRDIIIFQPHGFKPMVDFGAEIMRKFAEGMNEKDVLIVLDIVDRGGTAPRDRMSSAALVAMIPSGRTALHLRTWDDVRTWVRGNAASSDKITIMGARDDTLTENGKSLLEVIGSREIQP